MSLTKEDELRLGQDVKDWQKIKDTVPITDDEKMNYIKTIKAGKHALDLLVQQYRPMAAKIAHQNFRKTGTHYEIADLLQDAEIALVESALTYDPEKNCKLGTHAYYKIAKKVSSTINLMRQVRLPENKMGEWNEINKAKALPEAKGLEGSALKDFIAAETGIARSEIELIQQNMQSSVSLNAPVGDNGTPLGEILIGENDPIENYSELPTVVVEAFEQLPTDLQEIILFEYPFRKNKINYYDYLVLNDLTEKQFQIKLRRAVKRLQELV